MKNSKLRHRSVQRAEPFVSPASDSLFKEALAHHQANDYAKAETAYRRLIALDPSHAMVWSNLAAILHETGRCQDSVAACRRALKLTPDHLNAQINLATAQQKLGDFAGAVETLQSVLVRHPQRADLRKNLAQALERCGRGADAVAVYDAMLADHPTDASLWMAQAEILKHMGRMNAAIAGFAEAVRLQPEDAAALSSLGILKAMHSLDNDLGVAAALCLKAATLKPDCAAIVNNLGVVLQIRGETDNALLVLRELVAQQPTFAPAHANIGAFLSARARYDQAEEAFLEAQRLDPNAKETQIELTKIRRHLCDWSSAAEDAETIRRLADQAVNFMIVLMTLSSSGIEQLAYARAAMAKYNRRSLPVRAFKPIGQRRLRIGYLSADFRDHPVGRLMPDVVRLHDRTRFEIFGYALGSDQATPLLGRFAAAFDTFIDLDKVSDADAATRIARDEIDILIDLTGPTANSRFEIVAQRPAPVQVSFLGLPGTSGADAIDYIVADRFLVPPGSERFYHEQVVRLPHCYQPSDTARRPSAPLPTRAECGLPETGFVFCSFNSPVKISPDVFDVWMRLLQAVEGSVLWLYIKAEKTRRNLVAAAAARGIAADRFVFTEAGHFEAYLARMTCADLFLDTFPYAAGATCNDALWVGLPVLTCVGETYVSRMAGSLLTTLGLDDLVTTTLEDYERVALHLAKNPAALADMRARLVVGRETSALFDMGRFTRHLEAAYSRMAGMAEEGVPSRAFDVDGVSL